MKKKILLILLSIALITCCIFGLSACGHEHAFGDFKEEISATCVNDGVKAHKTCAGCQKHYDANGVEILDLVIPKIPHEFGDLIAEVPASCTQEGVKEHKVCSLCQLNYTNDGNAITNLTISKTEHKCGKFIQEVSPTCSTPGTKGHRLCSVCLKYFKMDGKTEIVDISIPTKTHDFSLEIPSYDTLASLATATTSARFYKTCSRCKQKGEETYAVSVPSYVNLTPVSITLSLYDTENLRYGINFNTATSPYASIIELTEKGTQDTVIIPLSSKEFSSYELNTSLHITRYKNYADFAVVAGKTYTYCIKDLCANTTSEDFEFTASNPDSTSFKFSLLSDSQTKRGESYANIGTPLNTILTNMSDVDFLIHSGDIVEYSKYEAEWDEMLDYNKKYLTKTPLMAVAGNHDTKWNSGDGYEIQKHFNYNLPLQDEKDGVFYSFDYGNVRFIQVNTNRLTEDFKLTYDQYTYINSLLDNNPNKWTIVTMHNPLYSVGKYGSNPEKNTIALALQQQLTQIFADKGVDIVLQGHDHILQRTHAITGYNNSERTPILNTNVSTEVINGITYKVNPDGTYYFMNGAAGGTPNSAHASHNPDYFELIKSNYKMCWTEIDVSESTLTLKTYYCSSTNSSKTLLDSWGIKKTA